MSHPVDASVFASAISDAPESADALDMVVEQIDSAMDGSADLLFVFITGHHIASFTTICHRLKQLLEPKVGLGATAMGVIGRSREIEDNPGLSVLAARIPGAQFRPFHYEQMDWPKVLESPDTLRHSIVDDDVQDVKALLLLADPFSTPMVQLLPALGEAFEQVPVIGGMASVSRRPGANRLLYNNEILHDGAVGLALGGDIHVHCTVSQGCRPIGTPYVITKAEQNVVQELAGQNALLIVREMVEQLSEEDRDLLQSHGMVIGRVINEYKPRFGRGDYLIRSLMGVDEKTGHIAIGDAQVRIGQTVQFHVRDQQTAREDFAMLLESEKLYGSASGSLLFSCNGRGGNLFDQPNTDALIVNEALGDVPLAGFFAAGEIGPVGNENFVHGHTASLVSFRGTAQPNP